MPVAGSVMIPALPRFSGLKAADAGFVVETGRKYGAIGARAVVAVFRPYVACPAGWISAEIKVIAADYLWITYHTLGLILASTQDVMNKSRFGRCMLARHQEPS